MSKFNVGDKVRVAADAGSANGDNDCDVYFGGEVEGRIVEVRPYGYRVEAPKADSGTLMVQSVGEEWLTLIEDKPLEPMVVGGTYWNPGVGADYTVTSIDFDSSTVNFTFGYENLDSSREFPEIEECFPGYCAPVKPSEAEEDAEYPETVEIEKLVRAADWLGSVGEHELRRIIKLAQALV